MVFGARKPLYVRILMDPQRPENRVPEQARETLDQSSPTREFLIERIMPAHEVHIVGGPSGVGKSRGLFQALETWRNGRDLFAYKSIPVPFVYVSADRSRASVERTFQDLGLDPKDWPILAVVERNPPDEKGFTIEWLFETVKKEFPHARLIVAEGLATFVRNGKTNDYKAVADFLIQLTRECQKREVTFLGVVHTSKAKEGEGYANPREKLLGSMAWAAYAETIFVLEFYSARNQENPYRKLHVLPRNHAPNFVRYFLVDSAQNGRLVPTSLEDIKRDNQKTGGRPRSSEVDEEIEKFLSMNVEKGIETFTLKDAQLAYPKSSAATVRRRLEGLCAVGRLRKKGGVYELVGVFDALLLPAS
jgi:hypothetical protein